MFDPESFVLEFNEMQRNMVAINEKNGFTREDKMIDALEEYFDQQGLTQFEPLVGMMRNARVGLKMMLAVGEIAEALEAVRKNLGPDKHCPQFSCEEVEIADVFIRLMNYAHDRELDVAGAIVAKNAYNRNREDHSKDARASANGKRF